VKTKKKLLIFLLIIAAVFQVFAETNGDDEDNGGQREPVLTVPPQDSGNDIAVRLMQDNIKALERKVNVLEREIDELWREINAPKVESIKNSGIRDDSYPGPASQTNTRPSQTSNSNKPGKQPDPENSRGSGSKIIPILYIIFFVVLALLVICIVSYIYIRHQEAGKKGRDLPKKRPAWDVRQDSNFHTSSRPPGPSKDFGNAGTSFGLSAQSPAAGPAVAPKPPADEISPLYHSAEKRKKRHDSDPGDIFLDVKKSDLERLLQGEKIKPALEKGGTRLSAQFVLVDNKYLCPNFHIYNEAKELSNEHGNDKVLSMIYDFSGGTLPGFVETCRPAVVSPRGDAFGVTEKGILRTAPLGSV
jgi:hypothetical protein